MSLASKLSMLDLIRFRLLTLAGLQIADMLRRLKQVDS